MSAAALMAMAAGAAQAQEYGRGGGATRGTGKFQPVIGTEGWLDSRGIIYSDSELKLMGTGAVTTWDETDLEHDQENVLQHHGLFVKAGGRLDLDTPVSFGVRLGSFTGNRRFSQKNPGSARIVQDFVTRPGFAGGIWGDIRVPLSSGMWIDGVFDLYYGQARLDNIPNGFAPGFALEGDYDFLQVELTGRFGFDINNTGVSPFVGFELAFFQAHWSVEDPMSQNPGDIDSLTADADSWSPLRFIFGVDFSPSGSAAGARLQVAIWNPRRDFGGAVEVSFPIG